MEINNLNLRFSGDKAELKNQLQEWCKLSGKTMNGTIIELIQILMEVRDINKLKK